MNFHLKNLNILKNIISNIQTRNKYNRLIKKKKRNIPDCTFSRSNNVEQFNFHIWQTIEKSESTKKNSFFPKKNNRISTIAVEFQLTKLFR